MTGSSRIAELRQAIQDGTYRVDADRLAHALLAQALARVGIRARRRQDRGKRSTGVFGSR